MAYLNADESEEQPSTHPPHPREVGTGFKIHSPSDLLSNSQQIGVIP